MFLILEKQYSAYTGKYYYKLIEELNNKELIDIIAYSHYCKKNKNIIIVEYNGNTYDAYFRDYDPLLDIIC